MAQWLSLQCTSFPTWVHKIQAPVGHYPWTAADNICLGTFPTLGAVLSLAACQAPKTPGGFCASSIVSWRSGWAELQMLSGRLERRSSGGAEVGTGEEAQLIRAQVTV